MLIIQANKYKNIDQALKILRRKVKLTKQIKNIRKNKFFIKKSDKRREEIRKATDRQQWKVEHDE